MSAVLRQYPARLLRVIDGDTVDLDVDLGFRVHGNPLRFRFKDVNAPERGQPGWAEAGIFVGQWFAERDNACIVSSFKDPDVYSRWLGVIWGPGPYKPGDVSLNDDLVASGHAVSDVYP